MQISGEAKQSIGNPNSNLFLPSSSLWLMSCKNRFGIIKMILKDFYEILRLEIGYIF